MLKIMSDEVKEQRAQRLLKVLKNVHEETKDDFVHVYISKKYNVSQQTELKIRSEFLQHKEMVKNIFTSGKALSQIYIWLVNCTIFYINKVNQKTRTKFIKSQLKLNKKP